jgi:hypothetical protein
MKTSRHTVSSTSRHDLLGTQRRSPLRFVLVSAAALDERGILAAMDRILNGTVERSNGALTIGALALEANVPANALTQRHVDMKTEFYRRVKERGATPEVETRLRTTIVKLKETIANKNKELRQLPVDLPALVRAVNRVTQENQQLRKRLQHPLLTSSRFQTGNHRPTTDARLTTRGYLSPTISR